MHKLLLIAGLLMIAAVHADVYRWVDENGQVTYSDRPQEGAERIELREAQTFPAHVIRRRPPAATESEAESFFRYESLTITSPAPEEVLWNIEGQLDVSIQLRPGLQPDHRLQLYLDGRLVEEPGRVGTRTRLSEVYRGTHSLRAEVVDRNGTSLIQSQAVNFAVQQTSIQNPNNPNVPRPR